MKKGEAGRREAASRGSGKVISVFAAGGWGGGGGRSNRREVFVLILRELYLLVI